MTTSAQLSMFRQPDRKKPRTLMHVVDAGQFPDGKNAIHFRCARCGFDEGWTYQTETLSQAKRGRPCPDCNSHPTVPLLDRATHRALVEAGYAPLPDYVAAWSLKKFESEKDRHD